MSEPEWTKAKVVALLGGEWNEWDALVDLVRVLAGPDPKMVQPYMDGGAQISLSSTGRSLTAEQLDLFRRVVDGDQ